MIRRTPLLLVLTAALGMTVACGQSRGTPAAPAAADWVTYAADVTGVRPGPSANVLLIDVSLPAGAEGCARDPKTDQYTEENDTVYANVVFESADEQIQGGCPSDAPAVVTLTAPRPLGTRVVVLNQQAWAPTGGAYWRCAETVGCHPSPDHCDPSWELAAFNGLDVPRHAARNFEHCDQNWLIMTVDVNSSACGAGGRPGCSAPPSVSRYFLRFTDGWTEFAQTRSGGCGSVLAAEPTFPKALCENLRAPG